MTDSLRVLLLEDDARDAEIVEQHFLQNTLPATFHRVETDGEFRLALREYNPDLILADYALPGFDGIRALHLAREHAPDTPFIFVTGTMGEERAVESLQQGAADYVLKGNLARLVPSVHRALERSSDRKLQKRLEAELQQKSFDLSERVKELRCLYSVSQALEDPDRPVHETLRVVVDLLPGGLQFSSDACATISLQAYRLSTTNFQNPLASIVAPIILQGVQVGTVEVGYLSRHPDASDGPFLPEERDLVHTLARHIGAWNERRKSTEWLRASEVKYRLLFESSPMPMWVYDLETLQFLAVNESAIRSYGYGREEFLSMTIKDIRPEADVARLEEWLRASSRTFSDSGTWRHLKKDGTVFDVEVTSHSIELFGRHARLVLSLDVTDRMRALEALERERILLRTVIDNLPDWIYAKDREGKFVLLNKSCEEALRPKTDGDLIGKSDADVVAHDLASMLTREEHLLLTRGEPVSGKELHVRKKDGQEVWTLYSKIPLRDPQGNIWGLVGINRDLTGLKLAEEVARTSELRFSEFMKNLPGISFIKDSAGRYVYVNTQWEEIVGKTMNHVVGKAPDTVFDRKFAREVMSSDRKVLRTGTPLQVVERVMVDGELRHHLITRFKIRHSKREGTFIGGIGIDITDRVKAEESLQESEERFSSFMKNLPGIAFIKDRGGRYVFMNSVWDKLSPLSSGVVLGRRDTEIFAPGIARELMANDRKVLRSGKSLESVEAISQRHGLRYFLVVKFPIRRADRKVHLLGGVAIDITDRKKADEALQRKLLEMDVLNKVGEACSTATNEDALLRKVTNVISKSLFPENCGFLMLNPQTRVLDHHPSFQLSDISARREPIPLDQGITGAVARTGKARRVSDASKEKNYIPFHAGMKSELCVPLRGNRKVIGVFDVESSREAAFSKAEENLLTTIAGQVGAVLERLRAEEELRLSRNQMRLLAARIQNAREEERTNIAREIHDELGQALTGLKMDMAWLKGRLATPDKMKKLDGMTGLINSTIQRVRRIATELRPGVLDDLGLVAALEWQAQEFQERMGIPCSVNSNVEELSIDSEHATAAFRIFQEALTNISRHARASRVTTVLQKKGKHLSLRITDNGRGITPSELQNTKSLGLLGMHERAELAGGGLRIDTESGKGTTVELTMPI